MYAFGMEGVHTICKGSWYSKPMSSMIIRVG